MNISRRKVLALSGATLGVTGALAAPIVTFTAHAAATGSGDPPDLYVASKDRGLKTFLAGHPELIVPENAPAMVTIAPTREPGDRLIVSGTVSDGRVPVQGASLYIYHADAKGFYKPGCLDCRNHILISRLHGAIKTDAQGRYQFETIRPGPYGGGPSHIHFVLTTAEAGWQFEMTFDDDPIAKSWLNGTIPKPDYVARGLASIRHVSRDRKGVWHVMQDIVLS